MFRVSDFGDDSLWPAGLKCRLKSISKCVILLIAYIHTLSSLFISCAVDKAYQKLSLFFGFFWWEFLVP